MSTSWSSGKVTCWPKSHENESHRVTYSWQRDSNILRPFQFPFYMEFSEINLREQNIWTRVVFLASNVVNDLYLHQFLINTHVNSVRLSVSTTSCRMVRCISLRDDPSTNHPLPVLLFNCISLSHIVVTACRTNSHLHPANAKCQKQPCHTEYPVAFCSDGFHLLSSELCSPLCANKHMQWPLGRNDDRLMFPCSIKGNVQPPVLSRENLVSGESARVH